MFNLKFKCMRINDSCRGSKIFRALLILMLFALPAQSAIAQLTIRISNSSLGTVIKQIQSQSKYQFFYDDNLASMRIESLNVKDVSLVEVLDKALKGKDIVYKIDDNVVYLSKANTSPATKSAQQQQKVTGKVVDANNEPLIGVSVLEKGTTNGTITDFDGNYTLEVPSGKNILEISYIGYKTKEITIGNNSLINIKMEPDTQALDEVVVIGYGTVKKRDLTGAVASMKNEDVTVAPTSNVMEALQGKIAGMDIVKSSGQVGEDVSILLRGSRSIYGSNEPLFIIDGIPGSYSQVNPSDIESVDVLKDASSTAIYGSAGANGVVIITTKRGKEKLL